jgi:hypothetical protein
MQVEWRVIVEVEELKSHSSDPDMRTDVRRTTITLGDRRVALYELSDGTVDVYEGPINTSSVILTGVSLLVAQLKAFEVLGVTGAPG